MFICEECEGIFTEDEFDYIEDHHPYGMEYATERWCVCPHCGSTHFVEAKQCSRCKEYVVELHDDLCDECYGDMHGE